MLASNRGLLRAVPALLVLAGLLTESAVGQVHFWQDPVVTHTNGMRLASSTPVRSGNVYWRCKPEHTGYCGGRMHGAMKNDLRSLGDRLHCEYRLPAGARPAPVSSGTGHAMDGLETADAERLGTIIVAGQGHGPVASVPAPRPAASGANSPAAGSTWIDDLQLLGEKRRATTGVALP